MESDKIRFLKSWAVTLISSDVLFKVALLLPRKSTATALGGMTTFDVSLLSFLELLFFDEELFCFELVEAEAFELELVCFVFT
mgnify:CR=1 FL=1